MRKLFLLLLIVPLHLFAKSETKATYRIGFSQCTEQDAWRQAMQGEMENALLLHPNLELVVKGANGNSILQVQQIQELIDDDIDILVVSPNESKPLTPIISEVYKSGIPVIIVDRKIDSKEYTQYIGADNYEIGFQAGRYAATVLRGEGEVMEIWGLPGSSPAMERHNGFVAAIKEYANIKITTSTTGEWDIDKAKVAVQPFLDSKATIDLVFAHNDFMALGAYEVFNREGKGNIPPIIGVDGLFGEEGGVKAVIDGKLTATFLYSTGGDEIMTSVLAIIDGKPIPKVVSLPTVAIDYYNAEAINSQMGQIVQLGSRIKSARAVLQEQEALYESQGFRLRLLFFTLLAISIIIIGGAIAYHRLRLHKKKIDKQNVELQRISALLEEATQTKLRFFTNVSHEFRTPITLLLGPLEDLLNATSYSAADVKIFQLMHRNAKRLLRLVNQIMDLRKLDNNKMSLRTNKYDIVKFVKEITESFEPLALQKDISFDFEADFKSLPLWFDRDKIDKSIFNLLSNAFKFTPAGGAISVRLSQQVRAIENEKEEWLKISVADTGLGMSEEQMKFVFDRFYQASEASDGTYRGSGVGLALTKELVELHQGHIYVASTLGEGTTFDIYLKQGDKHIDKSQQVVDDDGYTHPMVQIDSNLASDADFNLPDKTNAELPLLLIVEDNDDVRSFVRSGLKDYYRIQEAENGKVALEKIEIEEPDLIISDVMMPVMDGLQLLKHLKTTRETCHIPVIILSARNSADQKLLGLSEGADSYIPKPFNSEHLRVRVQKLIENRQQLRRYYQQSIELPQQEGDKINALDKKFLKDARLAIEENMTNSGFGVEELSQVCFISRVHLYRKIKQMTGLSATEFIRHIKLKKAASMLLESGKSSAEIAFECGFSSASYFSKRFKEVFKVSPSEYVAAHKRQ